MWTWRRTPCPSTSTILHLAMLAVGHQHGHQRGSGALGRIHEQFCSLVPWTPTGFHAEDSDDVRAQKEKTYLRWSNGYTVGAWVCECVCFCVCLRRLGLGSVRVRVCEQYIRYWPGWTTLWATITTITQQSRNVLKYLLDEQLEKAWIFFLSGLLTIKMQ